MKPFYLKSESITSPESNAGRTWDTIEEMRRGALLLLQGNRYFAWQHHDGSYRPCLSVDQLTRFELDIYEGRKTVGFYSIRPDNLTRWGALDFDAHGSIGSERWRDAARHSFDSLAPQFAECWLIQSSAGSFHVVCFERELVRARDMRGVLSGVAPAGIEIFPKQDALDAAKPSAKGSLLRFAGRHQLKGTWARFLAKQGRIEDVGNIKPVEWEAPSQEAHFNSLYAVCTRGIVVTGNGQRYHAMQRLAGRCKGRCTEEQAEAIYRRWHLHYGALIRTPLPESLSAFLAWFRRANPCNTKIPDAEPTAQQVAMIKALPRRKNVAPEKLAATVRLILSTRQHATKQGKEHFYLSLRTVAEQLGCSIGTASNCISACRALGIVKVLERGHTGYATTYKLGEGW